MLSYSSTHTGAHRTEAEGRSTRRAKARALSYDNRIPFPLCKIRFVLVQKSSAGSILFRIIPIDPMKLNIPLLD